MAQSLEKWTSSTLGQFPANWTPNYGDTSGWSVQDPGSGRYLQGFQQVGGSTGIASTVYSSVADIELLVKVSANQATSSASIDLTARDQGITYYTFSLAGGSTYTLSKTVSNAFTSMATGSYAYSANQILWIRFRVVGTLIQARWWVDGNTEPGTWNVSVSDAAIGAAGTVTIGGNGGVNGQTQKWYQVGFGTLGDSAPSVTPVVVVPTPPTRTHGIDTQLKVAAPPTQNLTSTFLYGGWGATLLGDMYSGASSNTLVQTLTKTHTIDSTLRAQRTISHTVDSTLKSTRTVSHTLDSSLKNTLSASHTVDTSLAVPIVNPTGTASHTVNTMLRATVPISHNIDATLRKTTAISHTVDASIKFVGILSLSIDTQLSKRVTIAHTIDSGFYAAQYRSHTIDTTLMFKDEATKPQLAGVTTRIPSQDIQKEIPQLANVSNGLRSIEVLREKPQMSDGCEDAPTGL